MSFVTQGIDSSSSAPSIAYSRSAWQQLVACHIELSLDPSLVAYKALMRYVFKFHTSISLTGLCFSWPPLASVFVVTFETLEVEGRQGVDGVRGHLMEMLKECGI